MAVGISRVVLYPNEMDRLLRSPGGPVGVRVRRLCLDIATEGSRIARAELGNRHPSDAPRTGRYARSFNVTVRTGVPTGFEFEVSNNAKQAAILEEGSKAHEIRARKAKTLVFRSRKTGAIVRKKVVYHPGQKQGYHVLWRATQTVVRNTLT